MTTGELIRAARKKAGLTQKELGSKLGVSGAMIAQYETGVRTPKVDTMQKIAEPLGVSWVDLYSVPMGEYIESKSEEDKHRNIYTELFFNPDIQKTAAAFRTNGFTKQFIPSPSADKEEKERLVSIAVSLFCCGEYPPDVETLIAVGFGPDDAKKMFDALRSMQEKFGEAINAHRKAAEEDLNAPQNHP